MSSALHRTITVTRHEWEVPAGPSGVSGGEVCAAIDQAAVCYRTAHGLSELAALPDDALWITAGDLSVAISFEVEERAR